MVTPSHAPEKLSGGVAAGALETLAARAREYPEEPWLFHRPGWTWKWWSYAQVADQVARAAAGLRADLEAPEHLAVHAHQHPDSLALALALQASGRVPVMLETRSQDLPPDVSGWADAAEGVPEGPAGRPLLPSCRSRLESWHPQALRSAGAAGTLASMRGRDLVHHSADEVLATAHRLTAFCGSAAAEAAGERAILATGPALSPFDTQAVLTWTLWSAAAWVLEASPEAFAAAVRWARPTVVIASPEELEQLAAEVGERRRWRRSRLGVVVAVGGGEAVAEARRKWQALGVAFHVLGK